AGSAFMLASAAFLVGGFLLAWVSAIDHEVLLSGAVVAALGFATNLGAVGALFWSARVISMPGMVAVYAAVWLLDTLARPGSWSDNPWKYGFALPIALLVFALVDRI